MRLIVIVNNKTNNYNYNRLTNDGNKNLKSNNSNIKISRYHNNNICYHKLKQTV